MLKQLHIQNFVIIDELDLQFQPGMTVFTGETGAGKSILIDALGLILGDRADSTIIRGDAERAEITAVFEIAALPDIGPILDEQAIEPEPDELTIRRIISRDGRSRAFVNRSQVSVQLLRIIGEYLIDIHGQHAHQSIMKKTVQRALLDHYARHVDKLDAVAEAYQAWHSATEKLAQLSTGTKDHEATIALLQYQVQELDELAPAEGEFNNLEDDYKRLANTNRLQETTHAVLAQLSESDISIDTQLHHTVRSLKELLKYDPGLIKVIELLDGALIQLVEATDELKLYADRLDNNPEQLASVEKRLNAFHDAARKHHVLPQALHTHLQALQTRLDQLINSHVSIGKLQQEQEQALVSYKAAALILHDSRKQAAQSMSGAITAQLKDLGMPEGIFIIDITEPELDKPQLQGADQVDYLVSFNPGQPLQPLRKVASGGELSRISLAIQIISKDEKGIPTLIFDEVDAGIGGGIAEIVGKLLKGLSNQHQIFCVTHLPQVASQGDNHVQVRKLTENNSTHTDVIPLQAEARVEEIARMLGGVKISDKTRAHAREMLGL
jgi:DNA repair protein RecN (Recombination protein N)